MGKHIQEDQLKTINGESLVGQGDLTVAPKVEVDQTTISFNEEGKLQLGVLNERGETVVYIDWSVIMKLYEITMELENDMVLRSDNQEITLDPTYGIEIKTNSAYIDLNQHGLSYTQVEGSNSFQINESGLYCKNDFDDTRITIDKRGFKLKMDEIPSLQHEINLTPLGLYVYEIEEGIDIAINFPRETDRKNVYFPITVNNVAANRHGNIELSYRDYEYEKFARSFPTSLSVYKYDREKMGHTFGDLFLPVSRIFDLTGATIYFMDENRTSIGLLTLPETEALIMQTVLPSSLDNKSFYIEIPS